jgi:hypothetical protein
VDRIDVVLRVPDESGGVPVVVRLFADGPEGEALMERVANLEGDGRWRVYAFALPGAVPEGTQQLYFELENQASDTTAIEDRINKWDRLPSGQFYARRMAEWDDQGMVIQVYARPKPSALLSDPASISGYFFPTAAGPFLLLEVIAVLSVLGVLGNHALQQRLPIKSSWQLRVAVDALIVAGIVWLVTQFLLSGTFGAPTYWV